MRGNREKRQGEKGRQWEKRGRRRKLERIEELSQNLKRGEVRG